MQSVPITTKVVGSNPAHGKAYSIQYYVMQFVSDFRRVGAFLRVLRFPPPINTDRHDIAEILLKVALNTITLIPYSLHLKQNIIFALQDLDIYKTMYD